MEFKKNRALVITSFVIKIVAVLAMIIDHSGLVFEQLLPETVYTIMRSIGRLAMPLFAFSICEGVLHTKSFAKYMVRLGSMAIIITIAIAVIQETDIYYIRDAGNVFIDLLLCATACKLLRNKKIGLKFLALLPLGYGILCYCVQLYEGYNSAIIHWLPYFIRTQYHWYSIGMSILFMAAYLIKDLYIKFISKKAHINSGVFELMFDTRTLINILCVFFLISITLLYYICHNQFKYDVFQETQLVAMVSALFIGFYSGKPGYKKKWFNHLMYLMYPLHILILFGIYYIITF